MGATTWRARCCKYLGWGVTCCTERRARADLSRLGWCEGAQPGAQASRGGLGLGIVLPTAPPRKPADSHEGPRVSGQFRAARGRMAREQGARPTCPRAIDTQEGVECLGFRRARRKRLEQIVEFARRLRASCAQRWAIAPSKCNVWWNARKVRRPVPRHRTDVAPRRAATAFAGVFVVLLWVSRFASRRCQPSDLAVSLALGFAAIRTNPVQAPMPPRQTFCV